MRTLSRLTVILLLIAFVAGPLRFAAPVAHAQFGSDFITDLVPVEKLLPKGLISEENWDELEKGFTKGVAACAIMTYIMYVIDAGSFKVPVSAFATELKENFIDCVMYNVVNVLIEDMLRSLTAWVQGGFKGNPVFVTRLNRSLRQIADEIAGAYIEQTVPFLCSPFRAQLQLQLITIYKQSRDYSPVCTLSGSLENIKRFAEGDFSAGGWDAWYETFANPYNNPYGAYIETTKELSLRVSSATGEFEKDLTLGGGFLSRKKQTCYFYPVDDSGNRAEGPPQTFIVAGGDTQKQAMARAGINGLGQLECDEPEVVTPGSFIEKQINEKYGSPGRRLEMADEMNELINAVILFLVGNIFKDDDGLLGYDINSVGPVDLLDPTIGDASSCDKIVDKNPGTERREHAFLTGGEQYVVPAPGQPKDDERFRTGGLSGHYTKVTIEYDQFVPELNPQPPHFFQAGFDFRNVGVPSDGAPDPALAVAIGSEGGKDFLRFWVPGKLDGLKAGGGKGSARWEPQTWYHFSIVYDAITNASVVVATKRDTGEEVSRFASDARHSFFKKGSGYSMIIGGENLNEGVSHMEGSIYENIRITMEPGPMVCNGQRGGGGGGDDDDDDENAF